MSRTNDRCSAPDCGSVRWSIIHSTELKSDSSCHHAFVESPTASDPMDVCSCCDNLRESLRAARADNDRLRDALLAAIETARQGEALRNAKIARMRELLVGWRDEFCDGPWTCCSTSIDSPGDHSEHCPVGDTDAMLKEFP